MDIGEVFAPLYVYMTIKEALGTSSSMDLVAGATSYMGLVTKAISSSVLAAEGYNLLRFSSIDHLLLGLGSRNQQKGLPPLQFQQWEPPPFQLHQWVPPPPQVYRLK